MPTPTEGPAGSVLGVGGGGRRGRGLWVLRGRSGLECRSGRPRRQTCPRSPVVGRADSKGPCPALFPGAPQALQATFPRSMTLTAHLPGARPAGVPTGASRGCRRHTHTSDCQRCGECGSWAAGAQGSDEQLRGRKAATPWQAADCGLSPGTRGMHSRPRRSLSHGRAPLESLITPTARSCSPAPPRWLGSDPGASPATRFWR